MKITLTPNTVMKWKKLPEISYGITLNNELINSQGLTRIKVGEIFSLHGQKLKLFNEAKSLLYEFADKGYIDDKDKEIVEKFDEDLTDLEFAAQKVWGFPQDVTFHNWWLDMPGCECPRMDNMERSGIPYKIYSSICPWHSDLDDKTQI